MTIEELLNQPPIDTLTDAQLEAILAPYFPLTRPSNLTSNPADILAVPQHVQDLIARHQKPAKPSILAKFQGALSTQQVPPRP